MVFTWGTLLPQLATGQINPDFGNDEDTNKKIDAAQGLYQEVERLCLVFVALGAAIGLFVIVRRTVSGKGGLETVGNWVWAMLALFLSYGLIRALAFGVIDKMGGQMVP